MDIRNKVVALRNDFFKITQTGFFPIIISTIFSKACALIGSIILVRIISQTDYGFYSRVINNYSLLFIFFDFGCSVAMLQYRGEYYHNKELRDAYFVVPFRISMIFCIVTSIIFILSPIFFPFKTKQEAILTQLLFLTPFFATINSFITLNLRSLMENKKYAIVNLTYAFFNYFWVITLSILGGVKLAILALYPVYITSIVVGIIVSKKDLKFDWHTNVLGRLEKWKFIKFALGAQFNNSVGELFNLFDVFLIGLIVSQDIVLADYKVASTIPRALLFIPSAIIIYVVPYFARNINNIEWVKKITKKLIVCCSALNLAITIIGISLADFIIPLIFGKNYQGATTYYIILMVSFFFTGSFHLPAANVIFTQHKVYLNIIITVISNCANCILDYYLIKNFGALGAAIATCLVSIFTAAISLIGLYFVLKDDLFLTYNEMNR